MQLNSKYDVYIRVDGHGSIIRIFCSDFEEPKENDILIDSGYGDKYLHCQNNYLNERMMDREYRPNFKYINDVPLEEAIVRITDEEKTEWYPSKTVPNKVNEIELLKQRQEISENALQELILMTMGGGE